MVIFPVIFLKWLMLYNFAILEDCSVFEDFGLNLIIIFFSIFYNLHSVCIEHMEVRDMPLSGLSKPENS